MRKNVVRVALRLSSTSLSQIIKLRPGKKLGIVGSSLRFGDLLYRTCQDYTEGVELHEPIAADSVAEIGTYLEGKDVILVPKAYEKLFGRELVSQLQRFQGALIDCAYEMDEGSVLYLETKIRRLLNDKRI